jgi:hypothetical protein
MAVVHRIPRYCLLVLHRCMVVPTVTLIFMHLPPTMLRMGSFALPSRIKQDIKIQYKSAAHLVFRSKSGVANFPYHPPAQVQDILLRKVERVHASRKRLEELAGENTAVKSIFLHRGILRPNVSSSSRRNVRNTCSRRVILPTSEIERRLLFVAVLKINILPQKLRPKSSG